MITYECRVCPCCHQSHSSPGIRRTCNSCLSRIHQYYVKNRDKVRARCAEYYIKNKERINREKGNYRRGIGRANQDRLKREWTARNREKVNQWKRKYRARLKADGYLSRNGIIVGLPPTLRAKLAGEMGNP